MTPSHLSPLDGWRLALLVAVSIASVAFVALPDAPHLLHLVGYLATPVATLAMFQTTVKHTQLWAHQRKAAQRHQGKVDIT